MAGVGDPAAVGGLVSARVGAVTGIGSVFAGVLVPPLEERRHCGRSESVRPQRTRRCSCNGLLQSSRDRAAEEPRSRSTLHAARRPAKSNAATRRSCRKRRARRERKAKRSEEREESGGRHRGRRLAGERVCRADAVQLALRSRRRWIVCTQTARVARERERESELRERAGRPRSQRLWLPLIDHTRVRESRRV